MFHGGSETLGYLIGAGGFGAVSGHGLPRHEALDARPAHADPVHRRRPRALALIVFSFTSSLWLALPMLFLVGMGAMLSAASTNTVLQTIVEDRMRARVMSIYMMSFLGVTPLGALLAGMLAERIGPPTTLALGGALALVAAFTYWLNLGENPRTRSGRSTRNWVSFRGRRRVTPWRHPAAHALAAGGWKMPPLLRAGPSFRSPRILE